MMDLRFSLSISSLPHQCSLAAKFLENSVIASLPYGALPMLCCSWTASLCVLWKLAQFKAPHNPHVTEVCGLLAAHAFCVHVLSPFPILLVSMSAAFGYLCAALRILLP